MELLVAVRDAVQGALLYIYVIHLISDRAFTGHHIVLECYITTSHCATLSFIIQPDAQEGDRGVLLDFESALEMDSSTRGPATGVSNLYQLYINSFTLVGLSGISFTRSLQSHQEGSRVHSLLL